MMPLTPPLPPENLDPCGGGGPIEDWQLLTGLAGLLTAWALRETLSLLRGTRAEHDGHDAEERNS